MRIFVAPVFLGVALATPAAWAQSEPAGFVDVFSTRIKMEKRGEYEAGVRKIAELNRKHGSHWLAYETEYGNTGTYYFAAIRPSWAAVETDNDKFRKAMQEGLGPGMPKFFAGLSAIETHAGLELRRRVPDLYVNIPASEQDRLRQVAQAKYMRTIRLELKPGRYLDWVDAWKPWQAELARMGPKISVGVSVTSTGRSAVVLSSFFKDMAEMDEADRAVQPALASDVYRAFVRTIADMTTSTNWEVHRIRPELSSMSEEFVALNPEMWRPKAAAPAMKKAAPAAKKEAKQP